MIGMSGDSKIYMFSRPTDMRCSFYGLCKIIYEYNSTPHDGAYYVFMNKFKNKLKILYWDGDGFAIWYKALQRGAFLFKHNDAGKLSINRRELTMILEGVEPKKIKPRFSLKNA